MTSDVAPSGAPPDRSHVFRLLLIWAVLTIIAVPLIVLVAGPHMPPGNFSAEARDQRHINILLAALAIPVLLGVWVCLVYMVASFRQRDTGLEDGPPLRGHPGIQIT